MIEPLFQYLAMGLDTLPASGRVLLLAVLLSIMLYAFSKRLPAEAGSSINVLYRKGALVCLLAIPALVYLLGVQLPVYIDEMVYLQTQVPTYAVTGLWVLWWAGFVWALIRAAVKWRGTFSKLDELTQAGLSPDKLGTRVQHWCRRVNYDRPTQVVCVGGEHPWHGVDGRIVLPAAAANWPTGVVDIILLQQIAALKHRSLAWSVFGSFVACVYWPLPWVKRLGWQLSEHVAVAGSSLARSAYRDPEGWRRDLRNFSKRAETLDDLPHWEDDDLYRLPQVDWQPPPTPALDAAPQLDGQAVVDDAPTFNEKWARTKERRAEKHRDPYEQAYWLIAVACLLVGVATTLTLVKTPPEFEPQFLQVKWQDKMGRRMRDYDDERGADQPEASRSDQ